MSGAYGTAGLAKGFAFGNPQDAGDYQVKALREAGVELFLNFRANEVFMDKARIRGIGATNIVDSSRIRVNGQLLRRQHRRRLHRGAGGSRLRHRRLSHGTHQSLDGPGYGQADPVPQMPVGDRSLGAALSRPRYAGVPAHQELRQLLRLVLGERLQPRPDQKGRVDPRQQLPGHVRSLGCHQECGQGLSDPRDSLLPLDFRQTRVAPLDGRRDPQCAGPEVGREFEDGVVPLSWRMDFHFPHPHFFDSDKYREGSFYEWPFISHAPHADDDRFPFPYWLPYRTLYSRNVPNLFMAGRDISVTQEALGSVRVQATTGMMGEIVGMAAMLCVKHGVDPRGVYEHHLEELFALMDEGTGKRPPVKTLAYEPFDFTGRLSGSGSGSGWAGKWTAKTGEGAEHNQQEPAISRWHGFVALGGSLLERSGGVASQRLLAEPIGLGGGYFYMSFLAQKDESGRFRIETSNGEHIRLGLEVTADGTVTAQGATVKTSSTARFVQGQYALPGCAEVQQRRRKDRRRCPRETVRSRRGQGARPPARAAVGCCDRWRPDRRPAGPHHPQRIPRQRDDG